AMLKPAAAHPICRDTGDGCGNRRWRSPMQSPMQSPVQPLMQETPAPLAAPRATRRDFLYVATAVVSAFGAAATLVPLIDQMNPDAGTLAAGAPVDIDLNKVEPGQQVVFRWRERPVFVTHRTPE